MSCFICIYVNQINNSVGLFTQEKRSKRDSDFIVLLPELFRVVQTEQLIPQILS